MPSERLFPTLHRLVDRLPKGRQRNAAMLELGRAQSLSARALRNDDDLGKIQEAVRVIADIAGLTVESDDDERA